MATIQKLGNWGMLCLAANGSGSVLPVHFIHDAPLMLLDEPTSNLDSLNEGIILKSLREAGNGKPVILVSHRESTMQVADRVVHFARNTETVSQE